MERRRRSNLTDLDRHQAQQEILEQGSGSERLRPITENLKLELRERMLELERREKELRGRTLALERHEREAEALYRIGSEIIALLDLDVILESVVDRARRLLKADVAAVALVDEEQNAFVMRSASGTKSDGFGRLRFHLDQGLAGRVVATGDTVAIEDYIGNPDVLHVREVDESVAAEGLRAHLAAPIKVGATVLGVLYAAHRSLRSFSKDDRWLLARLALVTSLAIQNARLYSQAQQAAVLAERERIGREIHDGLAQALGCIGMTARASSNRLLSGQKERVQEDLEEITRMAESAYSDAREAILGLRVSAYSGQGLMSDLQEYVRRFSEQSSVGVQMRVADGWPASLPVGIEVQLIRVLQEALSNVRKHAAADSVFVDFEIAHGWAKIRLQDNGRGFEPGNYIKGDGRHFGLQTMRERAASVGGSLEVHSATGRGTSIVIHLPVMDKEIGARATEDVEARVDG